MADHDHTAQEFDYTLPHIPKIAEFGEFTTALVAYRKASSGNTSEQHTAYERLQTAGEKFIQALDSADLEPPPEVGLEDLPAPA